MITNLHVKNLALIDEAEVSFTPGLNILTGETGAGKSILIGALSLAMGARADLGSIRSGETSGSQSGKDNQKKYDFIRISGFVRCGVNPMRADQCHHGNAP